MEIPKDKIILVNIGAGWTVAHYNKAEEKFVVANLQVDLYQGVWNDYYFENEWIEESEIKEWKEIV